MHIQKNKNKKKFINVIKNKKKLKTPRLVKNDKNDFKYEVNLDVDKVNLNKSDIDTIEIIVSNKEKNSIINNKEMLQDVDLKDNVSINKRILNFENFRKKDSNKIEKSNNVKTISKVNINTLTDIKETSSLKIKPKASVFGTKRKLIVEKIDIKKEQKLKNNIEVEKKTKGLDIVDKPDKIFQKKFKDVIKRGDDPAVEIISKKVIKEQSFLQSKKGIISGNRNKTSDNNKKINTLSGIISEIDKKKSAYQKTHTVKEVREIKDSKKITQNINIPKQLIKNLNTNNKLNLLYLVKDKKGKTLETLSVPFDHNKEVKKNEFLDDNFEVFAHRNKRNIFLKISNKSNFKRKFNIYYKEINEYLPSRFIQYKLLEKNVEVLPKSVYAIFKSKKKFISPYTTIFRVLPVEDTVEYSNFKTAMVKPIIKTQALPSIVGLSGQIDGVENKILINVKNIPDDSKIFKCQLVKRNLSKKEKLFLPIKNKSSAGLVEGLPATIVDSSQDLLFEDEDVDIDNIYEYKVKMFDRNMTHVMSGTSFIENFEIKQNLLEVKTKLKRIENKKDEITIDIQMIENDSDKLVKTLFGSFFELFKEDLKEIKDINSVSIVCDISLINKDDSSVTILNSKVIIPGEENKVLIEYDNLGIDINSNFLLKIQPKILPPAEIITKIKNSLSLLQSFKSARSFNNFGIGAFKSKLKDVNEDIVSKTGSKFNDKLNRTKGKIEDKKSQLARTNFDFYYDGSTGDISYVNISRLQPELASLNITNSKITDLDINTKFNNNMNLGIVIKENKILAEASISGILQVDFLIMSYRENNKIKFDGLAQVADIDESKNNGEIRYVYVTEGLIGKIDFVCTAVFKDGSRSNLYQLGSLIIDDDGTREV